MTGRWRRRFLFSTSRDSTLSPRMTTPKEGYLVSVISSDCLIISCSSFMLQTCTFVQVFFLSIFSRIKVRRDPCGISRKQERCVFYETESFCLDKEGPAPASLYRHPVSRGGIFGRSGANAGKGCCHDREMLKPQPMGNPHSQQDRAGAYVGLRRHNQ